MRKAARILAILVVAVTSLLGFQEVSSGFSSHVGALQLSVAFAVALYAILGVIGTVGMIRRRPWVVTVAVAWSLSIMWAATVASFAFHDPGFAQADTWKGVAAAAVSTSLIGWYVVWAAKESARDAAQPTAAPSR